MTKKIELNDTLSMKGVAIIIIILHNLCHLISPVRENEYGFNIKLTEMFTTRLFQFHKDLLTDIFSFLGWYGICVFLFISGYGLVKKYENNPHNRTISFWSFFLNHSKKLFLLMIVPYCGYLLLIYIFNGKIMGIDSILAQTLMISNLYSFYIHPGVYWYFGLMLQLYVVYYLFIFNKSQKYILGLILLQILVISFCYYFLDKNSILDQFLSLKYLLSSYNLLHNFIGWILPFALGIIYARCNLNITFDNNLTNLLFFIVLLPLLVMSNLHFMTWLISPILAIFSALYLNELIKNFRFANKVFIYFGGISAFLFATHPLVRHVYLQITKSLDVLYVILYVAVCILIAIIYKILHNRMFKKNI